MRRVYIGTKAPPRHARVLLNKKDQLGGKPFARGDEIRDRLLRFADQSAEWSLAACYRDRFLECVNMSHNQKLTMFLVKLNNHLVVAARLPIK